MAYRGSREPDTMRWRRPYISNRVIEGDFDVFLSTATGYGTAGVRRGELFLDVRHGTIDIDRTIYNPYSCERDTGSGMVSSSGAVTRNIRAISFSMWSTDMFLI